MTDFTVTSAWFYIYSTACLSKVKQMVSSNKGFCGIKRQKNRESQERKACKKLILVVTMMDSE